ncbi:FAD-binding oxidoreductase [Marivirga sp. S37H4]|uniref:FAD-binding oxidoreductase n=1 Tax=Marivirga aurantiaca TaxID=2802615 RepID=A0A934X2X0_9BACT|nr:FAD-binding oxidoreductase [Marivirga aurantiaca]MBK6267375.1 FAD-binding oxidoreductase [Marivirga aurantiaca]
MMVDFLIVGHGIAGICVAEHLERYGATFSVINHENTHSSSRVAAGLYNPITGRKMKKTWLADEIFPYLESFYGSLQEKLKTPFLIKKNIYRPFTSIEEQNEWIGSDLEISSGGVNFIHSVATAAKYQEFIHDPYGGIMLAYSGFLDLNALIDAHKNYLIENGRYHAEKLDFKQLKISHDLVEYGPYKARKIIFCDGPLSDNPYFNWVPTAPVKGEILHIETEKPLPEDVIFNRGVFIVKHTKHNYYRVGATYEWKKLDNQPTEKAKNHLVDKLNDLLKVPFNIVDQIAGVRPASKDRRPLIGNHPVQNNVFLFNGLGTKGVSLAPYFANDLCLFILKNKNLKEEVNISRYNSLHSR